MTPHPAVLRAQAEELLAEARRIENASCTGLSAFWCPLHGDCECPDRGDAIDDLNCPLHSPSSSHAAGRGGAVAARLVAIVDRGKQRYRMLERWPSVEIYERGHAGDLDCLGIIEIPGTDWPPMNQRQPQEWVEAADQRCRHVGWVIDWGSGAYLPAATFECPVERIGGV